MFIGTFTVGLGLTPSSYCTVNILAATLSRYPWGGRQFGFIITHTALLVLLVGIAQSRLFGTEGRILLEQGVAQDRFVLPQRSEIRVSMPQTAERRCVVCSFAAGPEDWPEEKQLELGAIDGIEFVVEQFRRHGANRLSPLAVDALGRDVSESEASIRLEAQVGGVPVSLWLDRNGQNQTIDTARGPLLASFGYSHQQLGFSLELLQLHAPGILEASVIRRWSAKFAWWTKNQPLIASPKSP